MIPFLLSSVNNLISLIDELPYFFYERQKRQLGFTLLELMVVIAMASILAGILAPSWLRFLDAQRLVSAQSTIYQGIQQAQMKAQQTRAEWQFSIRSVENEVEWSVHPEEVLLSDATWQSVGHKVIQLDDETTFQTSGDGRTIRFDHKGNVVSRLGRVTLSSERFEQVKRCVYVSTIIGAIRQSKEQRIARNGDFCH